MEMPVLEMADVTFRWSKADETFLSVDSFKIQNGERVLIEGVSGSGKSTFLNIIAGTLEPSSGSIRIAGRDLTGCTRTKKDQIRADEVGIIFQQFNLLPFVSILENVILPLNVSSIRGARVANPQTEAKRLLKHLGLSELELNRPVSKLSIGQQQRVAAARALIGGPKLIIADEPTSALDDKSRNNFIELLIAQADTSNAGVLFVSHDSRLKPYFDRCVPIHNFRQT